jgi:hypothetical protein
VGPPEEYTVKEELQKAADLYILEGAAVFENNAGALLEKVL